MIEHQLVAISAGDMHLLWFVCIPCCAFIGRYATPLMAASIVRIVFRHPNDTSVWVWADKLHSRRRRTVAMSIVPSSQSHREKCAYIVHARVCTQFPNEIISAGGRALMQAAAAAADYRNIFLICVRERKTDMQFGSFAETNSACTSICVLLY